MNRQGDGEKTTLMNAAGNGHSKCIDLLIKCYIFIKR